MTNNFATLVGAEGDIFWDLPPWVQYVAGSELGTVIFVANPTDEVKEYSLIAKLLSGEEVVLEEAVTVHGYTWFDVDPNDFVRLFGALKFDYTNVTLILQLVEKETDEVVNSVATYLVAAQWPAGWPGAPTLPGGIDWTSFMMLIMMGVMGVVMVRSITEKKEGYVPYEERRALTI